MNRIWTSKRRARRNGVTGWCFVLALVVPHRPFCWGNRQGLPARRQATSTAFSKHCIRRGRQSGSWGSGMFEQSTSFGQSAGTVSQGIAIGCRQTWKATDCLGKLRWAKRHAWSGKYESSTTTSVIQAASSLLTQTWSMVLLWRQVGFISWPHLARASSWSSVKPWAFQTAYWSSWWWELKSPTMARMPWDWCTMRWVSSARRSSVRCTVAQLRLLAEYPYPTPTLIQWPST